MRTKIFNPIIATAKALAIILMVIGHSGCPEFMAHFIYLFHMPVFFFCSGYFYAPPTSVESLKGNIVRKFKRIYMPYVKWSILFLLVHNLFFNIGIYNSSYGYEGKVFYMYSQKEYMKRLVYILLTMEKQEPLLGGYWFLKVLLLSSVLVNVLYYIQNHFKLSKYFIVTVLLSGLFICLFYNFNFLLLGNCSTLILAAIYIVLGYNFSKLEERLRKFSIMALFLMFAILTIATLTYHWMSMFSSHFDIIIYLFVSSIGSLFLIGLSEQICKIPKCVYFFGWIGKHTMTIFTFHFLAFKIVSLLIIALYGINYSRLSQFPVITDIPSMWWGIYTLAGVFIPIICLLVFNKIKKNCFREINILLI